MTTTTKNSHLDSIRGTDGRTLPTTAARQGGARWTALRTFLWLAAGKACACCGEPLDLADMVVCHVVPAGRKGTYRTGYVAGNLFAGCEDCNYAMGEDEPNVAAFVNPAGVPTVWPALSGAGTGDRAARLAARRAALVAQGVL